MDEIDGWLEAKGFRSNPFIHLAADEERAMLPRYFIEVEGYDRIQGQKSVVAFAQRGSGKSALRIMLAHRTAPIHPNSTILGVEYTDFGGLLPRVDHLTIHDHVKLMLRLGIGAVVAHLCGEGYTAAALPFPVELTHTPQVYKADRATRALIATLVRHTRPELIDPPLLYKLFTTRTADFDRVVPNMRLFRHAVNQGDLTDLLREHPILAEDEFALFWAEIADGAVDTEFPAYLSPKEQLERLVTIVRAIGLESLHFFVDRLDEMQVTANDPDKQVQLIAALVSDLPILEQDNVAVKFFLTQEAHEVLYTRKLLRDDRVRDEVITVEWDSTRLVDLLNVRLAFFSNEIVRDFAYFCQPASGGRNESDAILDALVKHAEGSPRALLIQMEKLCRAHIARVGMAPDESITMEDWKRAQRHESRLGPITGELKPILKIDLRRRRVRKGNLEIKLTKTEGDVLKILTLHMPGICSKDAFAVGIWDGVMSDETLARHISSLRRKLGDGYIETAHSAGYSLHFSEVIE